VRAKELYPLSNVCDLKMGQSPSSSSYNQNRIGIPFFQGNADFGDIHPEIRYWCNKPIKIAKACDILISVRAPIGAINIATEECCIGRGLAAITAKKDLSLSKYLYYALKSRVNDLISGGKGSTFKAINKKDLEDILIPVPSVKEQKQITSTLDLTQKLILLRKRQINALNSLVKSHFVGMFGDIIENNKGFEQVLLGENLNLINGRAYKQKELLSGGKYPVLRVGNFFSNGSWYYSDMELEENKYCDCGDLLYAWSASFGSRIWDGGKVIFHYHIWKVEHSDKYNRCFLAHLLDYMTRGLMKDTHGATMLHLTKSGMEQTKMVIPPFSLQNRFAAFIQQVDKTKFVMKHNIKQLLTICLHYVEIKRKRWGK
jgi:type I restriction enzyme S subunit